MTHQRVFEQSITIAAAPAAVEQCLTSQTLMHQWLNPVLRCQPIGPWNTDLGGRSRFLLRLPLWQPSLTSTVVERAPGLIVWEFEGFFRGRDRWVWQATLEGSYLVNQFMFDIPNPTVAWGFDQVAARWTQQDMKAQLRRLKQVAESQTSGPP